MRHTGPQFYDNAQVFETCSRHRQQPESANNALEWPVVQEFLGETFLRRQPIPLFLFMSSRKP